MYLGRIILHISISFLICSCTKDVILTDLTEEYKPELCFSVSEDDTIDFFLMNEPVLRDGNKGGFFSRLYPTMASIGTFPFSEAVECWRCGLVDGNLIATGIVMKELCNRFGVEAISHTMTARFYAAYYFVTFEDAMASVELGQIKLFAYGEASNETTQLYIGSENKNYWWTKSGTWEEVQEKYIRPKLKNLFEEKIGDNPSFPLEYQLKDSKEAIERHLGTKVETFIPPADSKCLTHWRYASTIYPFMMGSMSNSECVKWPNKMPLYSVAVRWSRDFDLAETDKNNLGDDSLFEEWKSGFLRLKAAGSLAIIIGAHFYRPCWANVIESELVSNGGTYPDEFVVPVSHPSENPEDLLKPSPLTGLTDWGVWNMLEDGTIAGEGWYPCPGTRLYQLWKFLLWVKSQGYPFMTVKNNLSRIQNKYSEGLWLSTSFLEDYDLANLGGYYIVGADGSTVKSQ